KYFPASFAQMLSYVFLVLALYLQLANCQNVIFVSPQYVCLNNSAVGLVYPGHHYSKFSNGPTVTPDGVCKCDKENKFSCSQKPSANNQLPDGELTCGNEVGCPNELKGVTYICDSGTPIAVLHQDGKVLARGSRQADGNCNCNGEKLACIQDPTGQNMLKQYKFAQCGTKDGCEPKR
ncbi:hypothetical protein O181_130476, partial [Austropuccinia psidii MF-1]|nr:hypothetical protein [Austropuccinia psidii MF-1]